MHLIIVFEDYELNIETLQSIRLVSFGVIETNTFGNDVVRHNKVRHVLTADRATVFSFDMEMDDK